MRKNILENRFAALPLHYELDIDNKSPDVHFNRFHADVKVSLKGGFVSTVCILGAL